jgi:hypothetical protein
VSELIGVRSIVSGVKRVNSVGLVIFYCECGKEC